MTKYREILRLKSLGFSERNIAQSCGVSRNTVAKVLKKAAEINLSWPLDFDMTDSALEELMFPKDKSATNKRMPNFNYIRKELLRNGVNKKLLWVEYCEECRMNSEEPLMYSQFCYTHCCYCCSFLCFNSYKICVTSNSISSMIKTSNCSFHRFGIC